MRWGRFLLVLLVATLLNTGNLLNMISVGSMNIKPDLLLILLLFFGIHFDVNEVILASFVIGFAADISGAAMGPYIISFGLFGSLISQMRKVVIMKRMVHQCTAIFTLCLIAGGLAQILILFKNHNTTSNVYMVLVGTAIYSGLIGPLVWFILLALQGWLQTREHLFQRLPNR